jgi:chemotaxis protein MotB
MATDVEQPIIIKKVKAGGHGHHGGAWKVAFADFVTAMMAFFLLMWLLNSTTVEQKASISAYFNDPLATTGYSGNGAGNPALDGGDGILEGRGPNPFTGHSEDSSAISYGDEKQGEEAAGDLGTGIDDSPGEVDAEAAERARLQSLLEELRSVIDAGRALEDYADQLLFDITEEGLRIQIVDQENRAMFDQGSAHLQPYTEDILAEIVRVIDQVPNRISISGHTDAKPYANGIGYSNWELSADRANAARRELIAAGLPEAKIGRVVGLGPSDLLDSQPPEAPVNRRISIVVLRGDHGRTLGLDGPATGPAGETRATSAAGVAEGEAAPALPREILVPPSAPAATAPASG